MTLARQRYTFEHPCLRHRALLAPGPWPPFRERLTLDGISGHLDSADVHVTARAMAAARHQAGKPTSSTLLRSGYSTQVPAGTTRSTSSLSQRTSAVETSASLKSAAVPSCGRRRARYRLRALRRLESGETPTSARPSGFSRADSRGRRNCWRRAASRRSGDVVDPVQRLSR
jgi:hypothetical protein